MAKEWIQSQGIHVGFVVNDVSLEQVHSRAFPFLSLNYSGSNTLHPVLSLDISLLMSALAFELGCSKFPKIWEPRKILAAIIQNLPARSLYTHDFENHVFMLCSLQA